MNVVVIVCDTIRRDFLGFYGGPVRTPNLDALASSSVAFENAYASSFPTVPARADFLSGTYAFNEIGWGAMPRHLPTVPELINQSGVTTVGVVDTPFFTVRGYNYDRGFQHFWDLPQQSLGVSAYRRNPFIPRRGTIDGHPVFSEHDTCVATTVTTAEKALEKLVDRPFLLYVDTWDPHEPFDPPAYYVRKYRSDYDGRIVEPPYGPYRDWGLTDDDVDVARACYCGFLEMVDRWVGRLLERIESLGLADETAVLFVSDHGFYFGEHGLFGKLVRVGQGQNEWKRSPLYPECANVPLMIRVPGVAPRRDTRLVSAAINLGPTLLDFYGIEKPEHMHGRSLLPLVHSPDLPGDDVTITLMPLNEPGALVRLVDDTTRNISEWQPITVVSGDWMLLFARREDTIELYDLTRRRGDDLGPNLAAERPEVVADLHGKLIAELRRSGTSDAAIAARS